MKKKKEMEQLDSELPEGIKIHANGEWYRELQIDGIDEPVKLLNTLKDMRLDGETHMEYKIRKQIKNKFVKEDVEVVYNSNTVDANGTKVPYINKNKK